VLGYDVDPGGGRLVVNAQEAERVRAIFALFEEHGVVDHLKSSFSEFPPV